MGNSRNNLSASTSGSNKKLSAAITATAFPTTFWASKDNHNDAMQTPSSSNNNGAQAQGQGEPAQSHPVADINVGVGELPECVSFSQFSLPSIMSPVSDDSDDEFMPSANSFKRVRSSSSSSKTGKNLQPCKSHRSPKISKPTNSTSQVKKSQESDDNTSIQRRILNQQKSLPSAISPISECESPAIKGKSLANGRRQVKKSARKRKPTAKSNGNKAREQAGPSSVVLPVVRTTGNNTRAGSSSAVLPAHNGAPLEISPIQNPRYSLKPQLKKLFSDFRDYYRGLKREYEAVVAASADDAQIEREALAMRARSDEMLRNIEKRRITSNKLAKKLGEIEKRLDNI